MTQIEEQGPATGREISLRQLGKRLTDVMTEVEEERVTVVVTRSGRPVAQLGPLPGAAEGEEPTVVRG